MENLLIDMKHISKTYPGVKALSDVELEIYSGEVHSLVGENGAGKSTLIKLLAGVEMPDEGAEIKICGKQVSIRTPNDAIRAGISVIYQDISLFPNMSIAENICLGMKNERSKIVTWKRINQTARQCLAGFNVDMDVRALLGSVSIAKQQIVAIVRAVHSNAKLIIMDEPTASLSAGEVQVLYRIIRELKQKNIAVLFVSHKLDEVFTVSDRVTILRDGQFVGRENIENLTERKLIKMMVGRDVAVVSQQRRLKKGDQVLKVTGLCKEGNFANINFELFKGEVLGLTGLVGAGRSEVARAIYGIEPADRGEIKLCGTKITVRNATEGLKNGIAYLSEDRRAQGIIPAQSMTNNLTVASLHEMKNHFGLLSARKEDKLARDMIDMLDIRPPTPDMLAGKLSGGNQQKVVIGKWLATRPKLLIVDEPTVGVDIGAKIEIHRLLWDMVERGIGVIMISSDLLEVLAVCSRVLVMSHGRITGEFETVEGLTQEQIMERSLVC